MFKLQSARQTARSRQQPTAQVLTTALALACATGLLALALHARPALAATVAPKVGEVSLLVGRAQAVDSQGASRTLERGSAVHVGDRIETQAGGHVHLQFVDGGRVSVRPASRLHIEDYSAPTGSKGAIRFKLEEGALRSITGQWGEAAKERFRLNTPLAAIGVKGTDFAVKSDGERTAASVYTGAITVAKLDSSCAAAVGPCANGSERLLTAGMKGQMLELSRAQSAPQFVPAVDLLAASTRSGLGEVRTTLRETRGEGAATTATAATEGNSRSTAATERPGITEALATTVVQAAAAPPVVNQLAWARLSSATRLAGDDVSQTFEQVLRSYSRPLVGNGIHTLMTSSAPYSATQLAASGEVSANFRLASAGATLFDMEGRGVEGVAVRGGTLSLDFVRALFSTQLRLYSPSIGTEMLSANGTITNAGFLFGNGENQIVVGAVTADGREAGYLFEKRVTPGIIKGVTLWGR